MQTRWLGVAALLVGACVAMAQALPELVIGDFAAGTDGFGGGLTRSTEAGHGFGVLANTKQKWVETTKSFGRLEQDFAEVSFRVRSHDVHRVAFRLVDATGQSFQQRFAVKPDGQWQTVRVTAFGQGESWGGAADRQWHPPARQIAFVLEAQGTLDLDAIRATLKPDLLPAAAARRALLAKGLPYPIADFEAGKDGFTGTLEVDKQVAKTGAASGRMVNKGESWVTATRTFSGLKQDFLALRFWVRSTDVSMLGLRFVDATGQSHQQRIPLAATGDWQQITVDTFDSGSFYEAWGGAADKRWHAPAASVAFIVEKGSSTGKVGTVWLDDLEAVLNPEIVVPEFELGQATLGNVFLDGEAVSIPVTSRAVRVAWRVTDLWGAEAARGSETTHEHVATIRPGVTRHGYYFMRLTPIGGDDHPLAEHATSFCVLPPYTSPDRAASPFGVMTHFAQGMDTDILPLLTKAGIVSVRDEHYWGHVEPKTNQFVFPERDEAYMAACASNAIAPLIAMTFENKLYDKGLTPYTPAGCDAYGRYGQALLEHYGRQIQWLEIWNEYNGTWCSGPAASNRPAYYVQMLQHAYEKIKAVRPDVKVLGCATVVIPLPYLEGIFTNGGLAYMDAVVLHPYRGQPEGVETEIADVQAMIRKNNHGQDKPIWITETGSHDTAEADDEAGRKTYEKGRRHVASYLARQYALLLSCHVERIYWYLCRDYQNFVSMGLLRNVNDPMGRYAVAPAYVAYATFIRQMEGAHFVRRADLGRFTYVLRFERPDGPVFVCWATQPDHVAFKSDKPVRVVDLMGVETTLTPANGQVALTLGEDVLYLHGAAEPVAGPGHFRMAAMQDTDVLEEPGLAYELDAGASGELAIDGQRYPVSAPGGRVMIGGVETGTPGAQPLRYTLTLGGRPCALGTVVLRVVDRVAYDGAPRMIGPSTLGFTLANNAPRKAYDLTQVAWSIGGRTGACAVAAALPPARTLALTLPVPAMTAYAAAAAHIAARFAGRAESATDEALSYNPCRRATVKVDGDLADWNTRETIDLAGMGQAWGGTNGALAGTARIAWDDANFYLAATFPSPAAGGAAPVLRFAVSPDFSGAWRERGGARDWTEWAVQSDGARASVTRTLGPAGAPAPTGVQAARGATGSQLVYEVALPWTALAPAKPADGTIRLALCAELGSNTKPSWLAWGSGITLGKTPDGFRICALENAAGAPAGPSAISVLPGEPRARLSALGSDKPLADSETDYSKQQGRNNWFYGFYPGTGLGHGDGQEPAGPYTDDDFVELQQVQTVWGYTWATDTVKYLALSPTGAHPGTLDGRPVWAVRRWQSDLDGRIHVAGKVANSDKQSDGVGLRVLVDGIQMYATLAGGQGRPGSQTFDFGVPVHKGSHVDFALTPGPADNTMYDASTTTFTIREAGTP